MSRASAISPATFPTFGDLLKHLRRQAGLTQRELSIAVGYSDTQISRMEQGQRVPDAATLTARFVPALHLEREPEWVKRLLELAADARHAEGPAPTMVAPATSLPRHSLPVQVTSFVGREREMADLQRLLSHSPLVTLIGAGGCGKTRLALQVASQLVAEYPDGVWFIELAPLSNPALVLSTVAATQDLQNVAGLDKALAHALRPKTALLILDNCEHVIQACAELAHTLLSACPNVKLLATSREALNIAGETAFNVPSLSLPEAHPTTQAATAAQSEAVRLFVDRARAVKPNFQLTEANASTIAQICRRLDGIPLALELAVARVRALSVEQIAARLDDRFRLLTGGSRAALPRHQTLSALMDWSYDLLSEAERVVLRRLAVLWGGWTLEAAEAVCAGEGIEAAEVLNVLARLVDKSLILVEDHDSETRYRLSETIREYALRRLMESGEAEVVRRRHAKFFRALARKLRLWSETWGVWKKQIVIEHDNVRAALDWAFENDPDLAFRLVHSVQPLWFNGSYVSEGRTYLKRALENTKARGSTLRRTHLLDRLASLAWQQGDYTAARALSEECAPIYRARGEKVGLAGSLLLLGKMSELLGSPDTGRSLQEEGIVIARSSGNKSYLAIGLFFLAPSLAAQGDEARARALLEEGVALLRESGGTLSVPLIATPLGYLGYQALRLGNYAEARAYFVESLTLRREWHRWGIAWVLEGFAGLAVKEEEPERAARLYGAAEALLDSVGARLDPIDRLGYDQYVAEAREQLGEADFAEAWAEGRAMTMEQVIAYALESA